ncbi:unnamed protein product [Rotaria socialis]
MRVIFKFISAIKKPSDNDQHSFIHLIIMPFAKNKILISLGFMILFIFLIYTRANLAIDVTYPDPLLQLNEDRNSGDYVHYITKRRFLPTRRQLQQYVNDDFSSENNEEDSMLNRKRYFLKSKRYFLNSKRNYE